MNTSKVIWTVLKRRCFANYKKIGGWPGLASAVLFLFCIFLPGRLLAEVMFEPFTFSFVVPQIVWFVYLAPGSLGRPLPRTPAEVCKRIAWPLFR